MHSEALIVTYIPVGFAVECMSMMLNSDSQPISFQLLLFDGGKHHPQTRLTQLYHHLKEDTQVNQGPLLKSEFGLVLFLFLTVGYLVILIWRIRLAHVQLCSSHPFDTPVALLEFGLQKVNFHHFWPKCSQNGAWVWSSKSVLSRITNPK